jgi:hypothetical protein
MFSLFVVVSAILVLFFNGSEALAVTGRDKDATQVWLSEAKTLLVEGCGGSSRLAEKLLREEGTAGRLSWGYVRKNGDAPDDDFWHRARIKFEESSAHVGPLVFWIGPGVEPNNEPRAEYLGIWVSRAQVLALLPHTDGESPTPTAQWAFTTTSRLRNEDRIPKGATKADLARLLAAETPAAVKAGQLGRSLKASYLENQLSAWGIWPLKSFK